MTRPSVHLLARAAVLGLGVVTCAGCSPVVRDAPFVGARDRATDTSLRGPFDGQVTDEATSEPVAGATVVGVWSYDRGDGLIGPYGSEMVQVATDQAGRYKLPAAPQKIRGRHVRMVSFDLIVYKRGYVGYRSDATFEGQTRTDFSLRHNKVRLRKWRDTDSHADHLMFLSAPPSIVRQSKWERPAANLDLYRILAGRQIAGGARIQSPSSPQDKLQVLDAKALLTPQEVRRRTGYTEAFDVKELGDLARTHFYHGVHLQAVDREETWDVAYRVWRDPPGGLDPVVETFQATLPNVEPSAEVTDETWVYDSEQVRAVAFLDRDRNVGVLLTCGALQCVDVETAIILATFVYDRLDELKLADPPEDSAAAKETR